MSWDIEWKSIENQIQEIDRLCTNTISTFAVKNSDVYNVIGKIIFPACAELAKRIETYQSRYNSVLSEKALETISLVQAALKDHFANNNSSREPSAILFYKETLNKFVFDFKYYTNELEGITLRSTERAFIHLQRTLSVNSKERELWREAFDKHEPAVEALGAVHLLMHGVWAFKIDSGGQRTDLVLKESFTKKIIRDIRTASEGLVLTEWKLVKDPKETKKKSKEAYEQAKIYSTESLVELELKTVRYLVIVSLKELPNLPEDIVEAGITYRHINVAIESDSPSIRARK